MKKFVAIGHWDYSKNVTCVAGDASTRKGFESDLRGNGFTAYMVFSEQKIREYQAADVFGRLDMIPNRNRHAMDVADYMDECMDIIEGKLAAI